MNIVSLFDGISCGAVALERAGIKIGRYAAYEIDENAIKVSEQNYPKLSVTEMCSRENLNDLQVLTC